MVDSIKVSVVIPVYNVEDYIDATLRSLLDQTYQNWQAIVVDDGSTDSSLSICQKYQKMDDRIMVYTKPNGGLSDARNYGLTRIDADLIAFLDGDDTYHPQFLYWMVQPFKDPDVMISGCEFDYDANGFEMMDDVPSVCLNQADLITRYLVNDRYCEESVCNKLFRRELFASLRFPVGRIHEDTFVLIDLLLQCPKYVFLDFKGYNVVSRKGSITRGNYSLKEYDKVVACHKIVMQLKDTMHYQSAFNKYIGALLWFILKTNGRMDNTVAYQALKDVSLSQYRMVKPRFIPFLLAYRCGVLKYIKVN